MNTQPEALRLAEICKDLGPLGADLSKELRRLHEVNQMLVEALCSIKLCEFNSMSSRHEMVRLANEALAKAREQT